MVKTYKPADDTAPAEAPPAEAPVAKVKMIRPEDRACKVVAEVREADVAYWISQGWVVVAE